MSDSGDLVRLLQRISLRNIVWVPLALAVGVVFAVEAIAELSGGRLKRAARLDSELNREYQRVMSLLPIEPKQQLRNAQRAWIAYRDKLCAFESTLLHADSTWLSKDTTPRKDITCIERLTEQRVRELKSYLAALKGPDAPKVRAEGCKLVGLPEDFDVYAVGRYSGIKQTSLKLGKSRNITKEVDVIVNTPHAPIVLVLSAYDPVVWKVRYTSESSILAVIVSGYHTQALLGIPKTVPAIFATYEEKGDCGAFYAYQADPSLLDANSEIRRITGKEIKHLVIRPQADVFYVGPSEGIDKNGLLYSTDRTIGDYGGR